MLGRFKAIREALTRTRQTTFGRMATLLGQTEINDELWDDLEALLIQADVGVETTNDVLDRSRERVKAEGITRADKLKDVLKTELRAMLVVLPEPFVPTIKTTRSSAASSQSIGSGVTSMARSSSLRTSRS